MTHELGLCRIDRRRRGPARGRRPVTRVRVRVGALHRRRAPRRLRAVVRPRGRRDGGRWRRAELVLVPAEGRCRRADRLRTEATDPAPGCPAAGRSRWSRPAATSWCSSRSSTVRRPGCREADGHVSRDPGEVIEVRPESTRTSPRSRWPVSGGTSTSGCSRTRGRPRRLGPDPRRVRHGQDRRGGGAQRAMEGLMLMGAAYDEEIQGGGWESRHRLTASPGGAGADGSMGEDRQPKPGRRLPGLGVRCRGSRGRKRAIRRRVLRPGGGVCPVGPDHRAGGRRPFQIHGGVWRAHPHHLPPRHRTRPAAVGRARPRAWLSRLCHPDGPRRRRHRPGPGARCGLHHVRRHDAGAGIGGGNRRQGARGRRACRVLAARCPADRREPRARGGVLRRGLRDDRARRPR